MSVTLSALDCLSSSRAICHCLMCLIPRWHALDGFILIPTPSAEQTSWVFSSSIFCSFLDTFTSKRLLMAPVSILAFIPTFFPLCFTHYLFGGSLLCFFFVSITWKYISFVDLAQLLLCCVAIYTFLYFLFLFWDQSNWLVLFVFILFIHLKGM